MPAVSCYFSQDVLEILRARAKVVNAPVSRVIREAVENYLDVENRKQARERVLEAKALTRCPYREAAYRLGHRPLHPLLLAAKPLIPCPRGGH